MVITMLHFLRRKHKLTFRGFLGILALACALLPGAFTGLFWLLDTGVAALPGDYTTAGGGFFSNMFVSNAAYFWGIAFFLAIIGFGIGRQLINHTARHSLTASLAVLAARLSRWLERGIANLSPLPATASSGNKSLRRCRPTLRVRPPPVALLSGAAPLLE